MKVVLLLQGHASEFFPGGRNRLEVELEAPSSINQILDKLGVSRSLVMYAFSEGVRRDKDYVPKDGEEVLLVSPPSGG